MTYLASAASAVTTWIARANQAWGPSRVWNSGISWEQDRNNWYNQANAWYTSRYNEGYAAGDAAGRAAVYATLNNPDGQTLVTATHGMGENGTTPQVVLTLPRTGHFIIGGYADGSGGLISHGTQGTIHIRGLISADKGTPGNNNNGTIYFRAGWIQHGDYSAGQQLIMYASNSWLPSSSTTFVVYAHFVPNATYHN